MLYADTCLLVSLHLRDAGSDAALAWLEVAGSQSIITSHWSLTEFCSALSLRVRRGEIAQPLQREAVMRFRKFAKSRLQLVLPDEADYHQAAGYLEKCELGLRAGDALHLAVCARRAATLSTADRLLADAADAFGVPCQRVVVPLA